MVPFTALIFPAMAGCQWQMVCFTFDFDVKALSQTFCVAADEEMPVIIDIEMPSDHEVEKRLSGVVE